MQQNHYSNYTHPVFLRNMYTNAAANLFMDSMEKVSHSSLADFEHHIFSHGIRCILLGLERKWLPLAQPLRPAKYENSSWLSSEFLFCFPFVMLTIGETLVVNMVHDF